MPSQTAPVDGRIKVLEGAVNAGNMYFANNKSVNFGCTVINNVSEVNLELRAKDPSFGVPLENKQFVERRDIFDRILTVFGEEKPTKGCKIVALKGLGGMGKTQLMLRYCYHHRKEYKYVFWLQVDSWMAALDSFRKLAINLGIEEGRLKEKDAQEGILEHIRGWLRKSTKWLLLLDNANKEVIQKVFDLFPGLSGDIILSTREPVPEWKARIIEVDKMYRDEALSLLLMQEKATIDRESARFQNAIRVVEELDYMPLAIGLARSYIDNTLLTFQEYLSRLHQRRKIILEHQDENSPGEYKHTLATVWKISFERIQNVCPLAISILEVCAFLHPDTIPVHLFEYQRSILGFGSVSADPSSNILDNEDIRRAVYLLKEFSFVSLSYHETDGTDDKIASNKLRIHRLVQKVVYENITIQEKQRWISNLISALNSEINPIDSHDSFHIRTRSIMEIYLPHLRYLVGLFDDFSKTCFNSKSLNNLLNYTTAYLLHNGEFFGTETFAQLSVSLSESVNGAEDQQTAIALNNMGYLYSQQDKIEQAIDQYERALRILEKCLGTEHPDNALIFDNLASLYADYGRYDDAELLYQKAVYINEKALGPEDSLTALSISHLAALYVIQGKYDQAESLHWRALKIREKCLGPEDPVTLHSIHDLGVLYQHQGKYDQAESHYRIVLESQEKVLGIDHLHTISSLIHLAGLYEKQGKYEQAEPLLQRVLKARENKYGTDHSITADVYNSMASLYVCMGKYELAEPLYQRALNIRVKTFGSEHPETATSYNNLAHYFEQQDKYDQAETLYQQVLIIRLKTVGFEHPLTAKAFNNMASVYENMGRYDQAELRFQSALEIHKKTLGTEHPDTLSSINNLGYIYLIQEKYDMAKPLFLHALGLGEKIWGPEHPKVLPTLINLASLYWHCAKYTEAEALYRRALIIQEEKLGPAHQDAANTLCHLGRLYIDLDKYDQAEFMLQRSLAIRKKSLGGEHSDTAVTLYWLGLLQKIRGNFDQAESLYKRVLEIREKVLGSDHPIIAQTLTEFADLYSRQCKYNLAETLYRRALTSYENAFGFEHLEYARTLKTLAEQYEKQDNAIRLNRFSSAHWQSWIRF
ncbi:uncharacterized protein VTP21DRAFT_10838 [Calcarisporiella thermophila]|uniref:uncharacterized protein n=1 Tax=Calcarisporiella thermophila TaxID=911321 RepID=UPI0037449BD0